MKLDAKQRVLVAIYTEYQKDIPNMEETITGENLELDEEVFVMALRKLENEGLIQNIEFLWGDGEVQYFGFGDMLISSYGIDYVEQKLGIDKTLSGLDKVKYIIAKSGEWGIEQLKDFGAKAVAEMVKANMGI
ncbi:YjcQ family protein [uncultured Clostridium sp.]|uniref:YjcQ family protein n=1 Tax=uncultured Clostridium sp. TaxID=59620 RepID=UPI0028ED1B1F|nr:YjcQ family protein [uncultured Clostridium sp.]